MRNDAVLYTGVTSASFASVKDRELKAKKKELKEEKIEKRIKLSPVSELVTAEIQKEIEKLRNIDYLNIESMITDEHFRSEMMARKKTIEKLTDVQTRLTNILREVK